MIILFNLLGVLLIALIIWWFWFSQSKTTTATSNYIKVEVNAGVYTPARIALKANEPITIEFIRKDNSPCSEHVMFDTLNKQLQLPLNKSVQMELEALKPGVYPFNCQMKMYTGELVIK